MTTYTRLIIEQREQEAYDLGYKVAIGSLTPARRLRLSHLC